MDQPLQIPRIFQRPKKRTATSTGQPKGPRLIILRPIAPQLQQLTATANTSSDVPKKANNPTQTYNVPANKRIRNPPFITIPNTNVLPVIKLKCRNRFIHQTYLRDGEIIDKDTDVTFICSDGALVKGHKIILATSSKYFIDMFKDQMPGEMSFVSVPDVPGDVMKLFLTMSYKDSVVVTSQQLQQLKNATGVFAINWDRLIFEGGNKAYKVVMNSPVMMPPPPPLLVKPPPQQQAQPLGPWRMINPMNNQMQGQLKQNSAGKRLVGGPPKKPKTVIRKEMHQASASQNNTVDNKGGDSADKSQDSSSDFQLQDNERSGEHDDHQERRKSKLTPRVEIVTDDEHVTNSVDPGQATNFTQIIKEWMDKVGKPDIPEAKRPQLDPESAPGGRNYKWGAKACTVCDEKFVNKEACKWHEQRHVALGLFKCSHCDQMLKTARAVWVHEKNAHDYCGIGIQVIESPAIAISPNSRIVEEPERQTEQQGYQDQNQDSSAKPPQQMVENRTAPSVIKTKLNQTRKRKAAAAKLNKGPNGELVRNIPKNNPAIHIGHAIRSITHGGVTIKSRNIRGRAWLYVCGKCDNCSDSAATAAGHYRKCYPTQDVPFETSVIKYRRGFYGNSRCPLCPLRFTRNKGFMVHCGLSHRDYIRLFAYTKEDKLECMNCQRIFALPMEFHEHLDDGQRCNHNRLTNQESVDRQKKKTIVKTKLAEPDNDNATPPQASSAAAVPLRSDRLAKKSLAKETEEKAAAETDSNAAINFPPADCPICGEMDVANISEHLDSDHPDLDVTVNRISTELIKCQKCFITFAICDLLEHTQSCSAKNRKLADNPPVAFEKNQNVMDPESAPETSEMIDEPQKKRSFIQQNQNVDSEDTKSAPETAATTAEPQKKESLLGVSPIDRVENTDLFCKETLKKALECGKCGKISLNLEEITDCLRSHGIHRCAICFNSYTDRRLYPEHLKACHEAANMTNKLQCPLCTKTFFNIGQATGHMEYCHWATLLRQMKEDIEFHSWLLKADSPTEDNKSSFDDGSMDIDDESD